jgi:hypothetical protein
MLKCPFGSVAEHSLGKGEVPGPIPGMGTSLMASPSLSYEAAQAF